MIDIQLCLTLHIIFEVKCQCNVFSVVQLIHYGLVMSNGWFLYAGEMTTCLRALTAGWIPIISELLYMCWMPASNASAVSQATRPPTVVSSLLTTQPWPIRQNGNGFAPLAVWYNTRAQQWVDSETVLQWAAYTWHWYIFVSKEYVSVHSGVNSNNERIASHAGC